MAAALEHCDALVSGHSLDAPGGGGRGDRRRPAPRSSGRPEPRANRGAMGQRHAGGRQLGGDAERLRPEPRQHHAGWSRDDCRRASEDLHLPRLRPARGAAAPARRPAAGVLRPRGAQRPDRAPGAPAPRARTTIRTGGRSMADEAYRAVFLRVHPTGKMVLSLTTEADGNEGRYAELVGQELGVPPLDVKVVPADENRFGTGHGYNTSPSRGHAGGDRQRRREDPRQGAAAGRRRAARRRPTACSGTTARSSRESGSQTIADVALYAHGSGRAAARRRGRPRRADGLPRLMATLGPGDGDADGPDRPERRGIQGGARPADRGHLVAGDARARRQPSIDAERRPALAARASRAPAACQSLGDDDKADIEQTIDDEVLKGAPIEFRSTRVGASTASA